MVLSCHRGAGKWTFVLWRVARVLNHWTIFSPTFAEFNCLWPLNSPVIYICFCSRSRFKKLQNFLFFFLQVMFSSLNFSTPLNTKLQSKKMKTNKRSNYFDNYIKVKFFFKAFFFLLLPVLPDTAYLTDKMLSAAFSKTGNGGQRLIW